MGRGGCGGFKGHRTLKANYYATFNWITGVWLCVCECPRRRGLPNTHRKL